MTALGALVALGAVLRGTPSTEQEPREVPAATTPSGEENDPQPDDGLLVVNIRDLYPEGRPSLETFTGEMVTELPEMEVISDLFAEEFARNPEDQGVIAGYVSPYDGRFWVETLEGYGEAAAVVLDGLDRDKVIVVEDPDGTRVRTLPGPESG